MGRLATESVPSFQFAVVLTLKWTRLLPGLSHTPGPRSVSTEPLCSNGRQPPVAVLGLTQNATLKSALLTPSALSVLEAGAITHLPSAGKYAPRLLGAAVPNVGPPV